MRIRLLSVALLISIFSICAQDYKVIKAPHRKKVTPKAAGTILQSNPVKVSKNIGAGRVICSFGGAFAGASIGNGTGRFIGAIVCGFAGSIGGGKAETLIRQKDTQEVILDIKGESPRVTSIDNEPFTSGDKVLANTNFYGEPLTIALR